MAELEEVEHGETTVKSSNGEIVIHCGTGLAKIQDITPYVNNPKQHPDDQIKQLATEISKHDWDQQIVVDKNWEIVIGHGRYHAAKHLGMDKVPVTVRKDFTDLTARERRIADNALSETGYDDDKLAEEVDHLINADDYDQVLAGLDEEQTSELLDSLTDAEDLEEPDTEDPETVETDIQEGEVYELGRHRLMCGDATNENHVEKLMDGEKADMVFTDPPYGKEYDGRSDAHEQILNDDLTNKQITKFYRKGEADEKYYSLDPERLPVLFQAQGMPKSLIVWNKKHFGMGDGYRRQYELIAYFGEYSGTTESDVWEISRDNTSEYAHPTQKPVELPARAIKNSSNQEDIVLDLFGGSGSTLLAAEQTQRRCFMMELDPQYCQVIINRWEDLTGKKAEPVET